MSDENVLPCPFCGSDAKLLHLVYDEEMVWGVFCVRDLTSEYHHGHFVDNYATGKEAIDAWNGKLKRRNR